VCLVAIGGCEGDRRPNDYVHGAQYDDEAGSTRSGPVPRRLASDTTVVSDSDEATATEAPAEQVLAALGQVIRAVSSSGFVLEDVLQTIITSAVELSRADFGNALRHDEEANVYRVIAYHGDVKPAYWALVTETLYRPDRGSMIGRTLVERRPVQIVDVLEDPEYTAWDVQKAGGYRTIMGVPMIRGEDVIGLFVLWRNRVEPFTDRQVSMLSTFADQAVLAIDNLRLFQTIEQQRTELARYAPQAASLISSEGGEQMLAGHRREITALFSDLRGFTAFAESAEPEEVLGVLRQYHGAIGEIVTRAGGAVEHFAGDGLMVYFNDPVTLEDHANAAAGAAIEIRDRFEEMAAGWSRRGYELGLGIGMALGFATLGRIGFEGRFEYGAVGNIVILASRLSDIAAPNEILISQRLNALVEERFVTEPIDDQTLKGFSRPVPTFRLIRPRQGRAAD
jgi:class 3 adenylate cyclase